MKLFGKNGRSFGYYKAESVRQTKILGMQHPLKFRDVPHADHVNADAVHALVNFHEGKYRIPEKFGVFTHQVLAADAVGDEDFLQHISETLKVPVSKTNCSNRVQDVRMVLHDKLCLKCSAPPTNI